MTRPNPSGLSPRTAAAAFLLLALAPLAIAAATAEDIGFFHQELGLGLGLVGLSLLLLQFAHAGRWAFVSGRTGIDVTMRFHRAAAILLLAAVVLHPLAFVAPAILASPADGLARLSRMFASESMTSGKIAWIALIATVVLALARRRMRYETWRLLHGLGAGVAAVGATHHALSLGFYSASPWLFWPWLAGMAGALLLLVWSWGWKPWRLAAAGHRVAAVERLGPGYWELRISGPVPPYRAGQFFWLAFGRAAPWDDNPFSVASAPQEPELRFVIREAGDRTRQTGNLAPGTPMRLDGPHGAFTLDHAGQGPLLLIAGGAGIAPILSLARALDAAGDARPVALLHGARTSDRLVCRAETTAIAARRGWRTLFLAEEDAPEGVTQGVMERARIAALIEGWVAEDLTAMICGPEAMTMAVARHLESLGVPPGRIVYELFDYA
ncbi:MAG: ferredoxin reductase family protein [Acetobacteraceae bacterium]|nr:ferredoxin reductase family protein [Acetobacteraceae bacterium]